MGPAPLAAAQPAPGGVLGLAFATGKGFVLRPCQASNCIVGNHHTTHRTNH
jgi:hypothetical protein